MSRVRTKFAALLIAVAAAFATVSVGTAGATTTDAGVCRDAAVLYDYYLSIGDHATASAVFRNMVGMGCLARIGPEDVEGVIQS
jgi:hypothetical protein